MVNSLNTHIFRGIRSTAFAQAASIIIQVLSVIILARLLTPKEYGLLAMVLAVVAIGEVMREFGLSNAAIQAKILTSQQRTNLFWINGGLGLILAAALVAAAPLLSNFYNEPQVEPISYSMAVVLLLGGLTTQPRAHLARNLRFNEVNLSDVVPAVLGLGVAVFAAASGLGVWALVLQRLTLSAGQLIMVLFFDRWLPGLPRKTNGMSDLLKYGFNTLGAQLVSSLGRNADYVILGNKFGPVSTGLYSRAFELVVNTINQINAPSTKVAVPILSRAQAEPELFNAYLLKGQRTLLFLVIPLLGLGATLAQPLVLITLGPSWAAAAPFVQVLALAATTDRILGYSTWWFALAKGRTDVTFKVSFFTTASLITGMLIGSSWGPIGLAWGYACAGFLNWIFTLTIFKWLANAPSREIFNNAIKILGINTLPVLAVLILNHWLLNFSELAHLSLGFVLYVTAWLLTVLTIRPFREEFTSVIKIGKQIFRTKKHS